MPWRRKGRKEEAQQSPAGTLQQKQQVFRREDFMAGWFKNPWAMPAADLNANAYYVNALCHPNRTSFAAAHMDLEIVTPSELIQTKTIMILTCGL